MSFLLHETLRDTAAAGPEHVLLSHDKHGDVTAADMHAAVWRLARHLVELGVAPDDRVAVYAPKLPGTAIAFYAASAAGAAFVPVNPVLKPAQVAHILNDCAVRVLVTTTDRLTGLTATLAECPHLETVLALGATDPEPAETLPYRVLPLDHALEALPPCPEDWRPPRRIDNDMAAILYTSGSTGKPKGVVISHRNVVTGAQSVATYLAIDEADVLLAVLPFGFDYGLNQLTSAVLRGARCVLLDYLLPRDVIKAVARHGVTGLAAVPPLWAQLAALEWPEEARASLRYITNSGGAMPPSVLARLRAQLPRTAPVLMYGLTEAFRSTYLPPEEIDRRPGSMGKAIPNAEIVVVKPDGTPAAPGESGELVHRGALVALGYWNDPERTAQRFKPAPGQRAELPLTELAVWSGDTVRMDEDGYLYFVGRSDGMIKTSGYRVSAEEIEEVAYATGLVETAAAVGVPHETLGQAIVLLVLALPDQTLDTQHILDACRRELPNFMVPARVIQCEEIPRNPNGKIDRNRLAAEYADALD